jgi:hypothetical protein
MHLELMVPCENCKVMTSAGIVRDETSHVYVQKGSTTCNNCGFQTPWTGAKSRWDPIPEEVEE